jgi:hypothetical protein
MLHERVSMLYYTHNACLVNYITELVMLQRRSKISLD